MTLPLHHEEVIKSPSGRSISVENAGEHHMGADHVEFVPSEPVHGVKRFFTTNGRAFFNEGDGCFYLYDSCMIIRLDAHSISEASQFLVMICRWISTPEVVVASCNQKPWVKSTGRMVWDQHLKAYFRAPTNRGSTNKSY